jgi:hypothetical protein
MIGANAVLTIIRDPAAPDRYGETPANGTIVWQGRAHGYLKRARTLRRNGDAQMNVKTDTFVLLNSAGAPILEQAGPDWTASVVEIEDQRTAARETKTFRVVSMENRAAGLAVDSLKLTLQET